MPTTPASATVVDQRNVTFSTNATAALPANPIKAMAELPNGKWIVGTDSGLLRLNANGTKDNTYLGNYDNQSSGVNYAITAVAVDASGGVVFSAGAANGGARIARLNADGSADTNFATDYVSSSQFFSSTPTAIKVLANGDILIAGDFRNVQSTNFFGSTGLVKVTATGAPVTAFNTNVGNAWIGFVNWGPYAPMVNDLEIDSQGRIVMAVQSAHTTSNMVRFAANGTPDTAFNTSISTWLGVDSASKGFDVEPLADGGYLLTGGDGMIWLSVPVSVGHPAYDPNNVNCVPLPFIKVTSAGLLDAEFSGTKSQSSPCANGAPVVVGGTSTAAVRAGSFYVDYGYVQVDNAGQIVFGGRFLDLGTYNLVSGVGRFTSTGGFVSLAETGASNWAGWGAPISNGIRLYEMPSTGDTIVAFSDPNTAAAGLIRRYSGSPAIPTVTAVSPTSGVVAGGTGITITGTNFANGSTVTVGGAACTNVTVVSATSITCTTPYGSAGTASVVVTAGGNSNTANALFTYNAPAITTTVPSTGGSNVSAPTLVTSANQAALEATPGSAVAVINGQPVAVETVKVQENAAAAAQQAVAKEIVAEITKLLPAGATNSIKVVKTTEGAELSGLMVNPEDPNEKLNVPVDSVTLVKAGNAAVLISALNQTNLPAEMTGGVIEVTRGGIVSARAYGLPGSQTGEIVLMSTPQLLKTFTVAADGSYSGQVPLPKNISFGKHTVVMATANAKISLGIKLVRTRLQFRIKRTFGTKIFKNRAGVAAAGGKVTVRGSGRCTANNLKIKMAAKPGACYITVKQAAKGKYPAVNYRFTVQVVKKLIKKRK